MNMAPGDVGRCSLWEFGRACHGFARMHGGGDDKGSAPSDEAFLAGVKEARRAEIS